MSELAKSIRELVSQADVKFTRWDVHRTALGEWHFKGEQATQVFEVTTDGFVEAIQQALQWRALPIVPRPKERLYASGFGFAKNGNKWRVTYLSQDCCVQFDTKRDAEAYIERQVKLSQSEIDSWELMYGWSRGKVEGVDFRYAR